MTNKALKAVRRRRQAYKKYKDNKHPAYIKASKEAATQLIRPEETLKRS